MFSLNLVLTNSGRTSGTITADEPSVTRTSARQRTMEASVSEQRVARRPLLHLRDPHAEHPYETPPIIRIPASDPLRRPRPAPLPAPPPRGINRKLAAAWFPVLWLFIGFVSSVDAALTVKHQESLMQMEQNPIARQLLEWEDWNAGTLIGAKFLGTIVVLGVLAAAHRLHRPMARAVATGIAAFQLGLLLFLTL